MGEEIYGLVRMNLSVVLDSNIILLHLNKKINIHKILIPNIDISIHVMIIEEVLRNINEKQKKDFFRFLFHHNIEVSDKKFSKSLFNKYRRLDLKKGDILIASFCETIKADCMITENRHFLKSKIKDFSIMNFKGFCRKYLK